MRVFISYAREDIDAAIRLYSLIRDIEGFDPWMDKFDLLPGMEWELEVMRAIEASHIVLLLLSSHSVSKTGFVQKEIKESIEKAKLYPPGRIVLIPIRLEECDTSYRELKKLHWVDMFPHWRAGEQQLLRTLVQVRIDTHAGLLTQLVACLPRKHNESRLRTREEFLDAARRSQDFTGYNLMYLDLSKLDLSGFNFSGANLVGVNLSGCQLNNTIFKWANLERANLDRANLSHSLLACTNLWRATMKRARHLRLAVVENSNIFGLIGVSDSQKARFMRVGGFEAGNYELFFSHLKDSALLSAEDIVKSCLWLAHRYFRLLFSDEARIAFGHLAKFYHELFLTSGEVAEEKGIFLIDAPGDLETVILLEDAITLSHEWNHKLLDLFGNKGKNSKG